MTRRSKITQRILNHIDEIGQQFYSMRDLAVIGGRGDYRRKILHSKNQNPGWDGSPYLPIIEELRPNYRKTTHPRGLKRIKK